jgi:hypothetical protein
VRFFPIVACPLITTPIAICNIFTPPPP